MYHQFSLIFAICAYTLAGGLLYIAIPRQSAGLRRSSIVAAFAGVIAHAIAQSHHWGASPALDVSLLNLRSLCAMIIVLMICVSVFSKDTLYDASLVALPVAVIILAVERSIPVDALQLDQVSAGTSWHILSSILAFGLLSIAGVYALFAAFTDYFLRRHHLNPLVRSLPPLEVLERLLFQLIAAGFFLLTISLISGLTFVDDLFAQHLAHKTLLSILAWVIFGLLLWGRWRYGWRGRHAVRLTLAGIMVLLLAYFGSKLVLELILGRSWQLN